MLAPSTGRRAFGRALAFSSSPVTVPGFLVPAFQTITPPTASPRRNFSATTNRPSKLGRNPITIPQGVELSIGDLFVKKDATTYLQQQKRKVTVTGPLGTQELDVPAFINMDVDPASRRITLSVQDKNVKKQMEMWGTTWSYLNNFIMGVSEGHTAVLRLVGIGYRATVEPRPEQEEYPGQQFVCLKLGFSHPVELGLPKGMKASAPLPTRVLLEGINKETLMSYAADLRKWRRPEPYKGKGIFINDETIKLKQKKIK
ncbi:ribosomal protein L6, alpha-beta domain-containing protein [Cladorrhinum samala]|uniref:Ribosomal protein L6, alpha-beta domain-containing protein n=1 Tax=Cladorrhinum samala TaxID=585594 RepID=A0AAV9HQ46_9PEZI|nr:ribosomal protein L6, alpha-beta domain-containing protein [Cladorrhinum samala]